MLMRFDPFREFDRLADEVYANGRRKALSTMAMDAYREGDHFVVHFDLPGVDPDSLDVTVEDNVLNVTASRSWERNEEREWIASERYQGTLQRQLFLGDTLDPDHIEARYEHGVLTLTIPVAERAKPRRVPVAAGTANEAIAAESRAT